MELARQVRPLLAGRELAGLAAQVPLEPIAVADIAGRAVRPDEPVLVDHPDAVDLDKDVVPVRVLEGES